MRSYLKLVNFEVNRFFKMYAVLVVLTIVSQLIGCVVVANRYMNEANRMMYKNLMPKSQFILDYGQFSFGQVVNSFWFLFPVYFCITVLMIYVFFIWYRDWLGKNTFAYRLFTLPVARVTMYIAKLKTILLFVLGLVAVQIVVVAVGTQIVQMIVPDGLRIDLPLQSIFTINLFPLLYPNSLLEFIFLYGLGAVFVSVIFTAILFERSYRWKGIVLGVVYVIVAFFAYISPKLINTYLWVHYFYPSEMLWMMVAISVVILASAVWIANYLLNHKIKV